MLRNVYLGFIRVHVLHHAVEEPIYGAAMIEELERHGYAMSAGTFYPLIHDMEEKGYLDSKERVVEGRVRKYYRATEEGREVLAEIRVKLAELANEVIGGEDAQFDVDDRNEDAR